MRTTTVITAALFVLALASSVTAAVNWPNPPSTSDWVGLTVSNAAATDPDDFTPDGTDIRGGVDDNSNTYTSAYWYEDLVGQHLMFRMRVDQKPNNPQTVWQFFLDTDTDSDIDWILQLNESGGSIVELNEATTGGTTFGDVVIDTTPDWSGATATYSRWVDPTGDSSSFDGEADAFVDVAIPWASFSSITGVNAGDSISVGLSTSTSHSVINKDLPASLTQASNVSDGFTDSITTNDLLGAPEPTSLALMGLGLGLLFLLRRRLRPAARRA